jgi:2-polyprenyl-3-methyl-5-hydroxy-6-metoxy-1,4-benzoquinol methylase
MNKEWFETWFDTDYYHLLYQHRDETEAKRFIQNLTHHLQIPSRAKVLDLACGKGRHAFVLANLGFETMGVDISKNSIQLAQDHFKLPNLSFAIHDMRQVIASNYFDAVFNLFTSFGYFDNLNQNNKVIKAIYTALKPGGIVVIDFINTHYAIKNLIPFDEKILNGIVFKQHRSILNNNIHKAIEVHDNGKILNFEEKIQILSDEYFNQILSKYGFKILSEFGNYQLDSYDKNNSNRYIVVAQKLE